MKADYKTSIQSIILTSQLIQSGLAHPALGPSSLQEEADLGLSFLEHFHHSIRLQPQHDVLLPNVFPSSNQLAKHSTLRPLQAPIGLQPESQLYHPSGLTQSLQQPQHIGREGAPGAFLSSQPFGDPSLAIQAPYEIPSSHLSRSQEGFTYEQLGENPFSRLGPSPQPQPYNFVQSLPHYPWLPSPYGPLRENPQRARKSKSRNRNYQASRDESENDHQAQFTSSKKIKNTHFSEEAQQSSTISNSEPSVSGITTESPISSIRSQKQSQTLAQTGYQNLNHLNWLEHPFELHAQVFSSKELQQKALSSTLQPIPGILHPHLSPSQLHHPPTKDVLEKLLEEVYKIPTQPIYQKVIPVIFADNDFSPYIHIASLQSRLSCNYKYFTELVSNVINAQLVYYQKPQGLSAFSDSFDLISLSSDGFFIICSQTTPSIIPVSYEDLQAKIKMMVHQVWFLQHNFFSSLQISYSSPCYKTEQKQLMNWLLCELFSPKGSLPVFGKQPTSQSSRDRPDFAPFQKSIIKFISEPKKTAVQSAEVARLGSLSWSEEDAASLKLGLEILASYYVTVKSEKWNSAFRTQQIFLRKMSTVISSLINDKIIIGRGDNMRDFWLDTPPKQARAKNSSISKAQESM
ncbi:hypothetical protein O181_008234 [Austropuccinia psidii MF-1]|uniref:Uncharacterized protein n=1 Tax=Austropuccinia psidii MF-1 TaxID=1389203 RepID=A0A9Q3GIN6_9BASI|nr:hypothetical protein [Austropuccinia psidii MF-1]